MTLESVSKEVGISQFPAMVKMRGKKKTAFIALYLFLQNRMFLTIEKGQCKL